MQYFPFIMKISRKGFYILLSTSLCMFFFFFFLENLCYNELYSADFIYPVRNRICNCTNKELPANRWS